MPYNHDIAGKLRLSLADIEGIHERKMFGGICFMMRGHMLCGVEKDSLVVRVGPQNYEQILKRKFVRPMDFTGRPLKGFIYVSEEGMKTKTSLKKWVDMAVTFVSTLPRK